jgi:hypothetical protein
MIMSEYGWTQASLSDFQPLHPAERKIIAELKRGDFDRLGDGLRPATDDPERRVRASLLRFLLLGGDPNCRPHEKGVRVSGAWIEGPLDLEGCRIPRDIGLKDCRFDAVPVLRSAIIDNLFVDGSWLPGLQADRLEARGGLYLRGAEIKGEIRLVGSRLGGNFEGDGMAVSWADGFAVNAEGLEARAILMRGASVEGGIHFGRTRLGADFDAVGATLKRPEGVAINADGLEARGNVALRSAKIEGEVRFVGARIGGDLDCTGGQFDQAGGDALQINRAFIQGAFFLRQGARVQGTLDLTGATIGTLHDEAACWPGKGDVLLNRCRYGAFIDGPVDAPSRLNWLARQSPERWGEDFWPQPYEQLATVFRDMGHDDDARAVLIEKERLQRFARRQRAKKPLLRAALGFVDWVLGATIVYGRQPLLAFAWLGLFWIIGVAVFAQAERQGAFKPNSAVILRSPEWTLCGIDAGQSVFLPTTQQTVGGRRAPGQSQLACFRQQLEASSYPEFNPWMFSLDTLFPVVEIGQRAYWRPDPSQDWGNLAKTYYYFEASVGWVLSLLAVAGFSGIVKSR